MLIFLSYFYFFLFIPRSATTCLQTAHRRTSRSVVFRKEWATASTCTLSTLKVAVMWPPLRLSPWRVKPSILVRNLQTWIICRMRNSEVDPPNSYSWTPYPSSCGETIGVAADGGVNEDIIIIKPSSPFVFTRISKSTCEGFLWRIALTYMLSTLRTGAMWPWLRLSPWRVKLSILVRHLLCVSMRIRKFTWNQRLLEVFWRSLLVEIRSSARMCAMHACIDL